MKSRPLRTVKVSAAAHTARHVELHAALEEALARHAIPDTMLLRQAIQHIVVTPELDELLADYIAVRTRPLRLSLSPLAGTVGQWRAWSAKQAAGVDHEARKVIAW